MNLVIDSDAQVARLGQTGLSKPFPSNPFTHTASPGSIKKLLCVCQAYGLGPAEAHVRRAAEADALLLLRKLLMSRSRLAGQTRDKAVTAGASARDKLVQLTKFGSKRADRDTEKEDLAEDSAPSDHVPVEEVITQVTSRDQASLDSSTQNLLAGTWLPFHHP